MFELFLLYVLTFSPFFPLRKPEYKKSGFHKHQPHAFRTITVIIFNGRCTRLHATGIIIELLIDLFGDEDIQLLLLNYINTCLCRLYL